MVFGVISVAAGHPAQIRPTRRTPHGRIQGFFLPLEEPSSETLLGNTPKMSERRHNCSPNGRHNSWGNPSRPINVRTPIGGTHSPLSWTTFRSARRPQPMRHRTHSKPICFSTFVASHHSTPLNDEPQQPVQKGRGRR